jgi:hypothetical protein
LTFFEGDWLQFSGLSVGLAPNTQYAFTVQNDTQGYEEIGADGYPYGDLSVNNTNDQAVLIPVSGGQLGANNYSTVAGWEANMDIGLSIISYITVDAPTITPGNIVSTGAVATVTSGVVLGPGPYFYQWQTDGGSGGALTNIPGQTGTSLTVNTTGYNLGNYRYDVVVTNSAFQSDTSSVASLTVDHPILAAAMADDGSTVTPNVYDISQLTGGGSGDGLNYYDNNSDTPGQIFTTGTNSLGYTLTSVAIDTGGNGNFSLINVAQNYYLYLFSIDSTGSNAVLLQEYTNGGFDFASFGNWVQWGGLNLQLSPNKKYAYTFENESGVQDITYNDGYCQLNQETNGAYAGGELCLIEPQGGAVYFGNSHTNVLPSLPYSATFDLGLSPNGVVILTPHANPITSTPNGGLVGTVFTNNEAADGAAPLSYKWLTDGGTGGAITNIVGINSSNLVVNTTGWNPGVYAYQVVVTNTYGSSTSSVDSVPILLASITNSGILKDLGYGYPNPEYSSTPFGVPTPGPYDIYQTNGAYVAGNNSPPGLNYYINNLTQPPGDTFTTGTNAAGYVLNSVAVQLGGDDYYSSWPAGGQAFLVNVYHVYPDQAGSYGALYARYVSQTNFVITYAVNDVNWLEMSNLSLPLAPNTAYAYSFVQVGTATYDSLADVNSSFVGGELAETPATDGQIILASGWSGTFDLGLSLGASSLSIQHIGGGQLQLQWSAGALLQSTNLLGPWTTNNAATSPYDVTPTGPQMFYRTQ